MDRIADDRVRILDRRLLRSRTPTPGSGYRRPRWHRRPARSDGSAGDWWHGTTKATPRITRPPRTAGRPRPQNPFGFGECYPQERRHGDEHVRVVLRQGSGGRRPKRAAGRSPLAASPAPTVPVWRHRLKRYPDRLARAGRSRDRDSPPPASWSNTAAHASDARAPPSRTGRTAPSRQPPSIAAPPMRRPRRCTLRQGNSTRASESATHGSATRSPSSQPGPGVRSSPGISRWMAGTLRGLSAGRPPTRRAARGRSKGSNAERRHGSGTCTSPRTPGRRLMSQSPSASGGSRRSRLTKNADAARAAF